MEFQLLIKTKMLKIKIFLALKLSNDVFILLINVKMPTIIVGISTFSSRINFKLSYVEHDKSFWLFTRHQGKVYSVTLL